MFIGLFIDFRGVTVMWTLSDTDIHAYYYAFCNIWCLNVIDHVIICLTESLNHTRFLKTLITLADLEKQRLQGCDYTHVINS